SVSASIAEQKEKPRQQRGDDPAMAQDQIVEDLAFRNEDGDLASAVGQRRGGMDVVCEAEGIAPRRSAEHDRTQAVADGQMGVAGQRGWNGDRVLRQGAKLLGTDLRCRKRGYKCRSVP